MDGPRKATDVLLELETKIEALLSIARNQDLSLKILSNKVNMLLEEVKNVESSPSNQPTIEAVHANLPINSMFGERDFEERNIPIQAESSIKIDTSPNGFRRTSRPETYAGDNVYLPENKQKENKPAEVIVQQKKYQADIAPPVEDIPASKSTSTAGSIPVQQRTVDKNGKSIFLADIEIVNADTGVFVYKTRTNGAGKWMASLLPGKYKVSLKKKESLSKDKIEAIQEIMVDGLTSPLELPMIIVK